MTIMLLLIMGALGVGGLVVALAISREKGELAERVRQLEKQAEIIRQQAEIIAKPRTDDETIDRLDRGAF